MLRMNSFYYFVTKTNRYKFYTFTAFSNVEKFIQRSNYSSFKIKPKVVKNHFVIV
jgi:hypothetical protein